MYRLLEARIFSLPVRHEAPTHEQTRQRSDRSQTRFLKKPVFIPSLVIIFISMSLAPDRALAQVEFIVPDRGLQDTDGNFVYLNQGIGAEFCIPIGAVLRAPVTGGSSTTLYEDCDLSPFYVRVDGPQLFILDWGAEDILKLPITGGTPLKLADSEGAIFERGFDTDANFVYWNDTVGVKRTFKTGLGTMTLATIPNFGAQLQGLAVDSTHAYYIETHFSPPPFTYSVKRVPKDGGAVQTLFTSAGVGCWTVREIVVDNSHAYWLEAICDEPNVIKRMPKDGSASPSTLYDAGPSRLVTGLELRSNLLLFTESPEPTDVVETTGKIRHMPKTGGAISDLVTGLTQPRGLVTDTGFAYWSDNSGRVGGVSGTKRVPLPPLDNDGDGFDQSVDCDDNDPSVTVGNTCVSDSEVTVESDSGEVTVTFPNVTGGGTTTIVVTECAPSDVEGITLVPTAPLCADITSDASFEGDVKVCIMYDDTGLTLVQEANLQMVSCDASGSCELLACDPPEPVDTVNNIVCGCTDSFSTFAVGTAIDSDGDFTPDLLDNCAVTPNLFQEDTDGDGIGNACDPDLNNDGIVGLPDFNIFRAAFGSSLGDINYNPDADFNSDDTIGLPDFNVLRQFFGNPPGEN